MYHPIGRDPGSIPPAWSALAIPGASMQLAPALFKYARFYRCVMASDAIKAIEWYQKRDGFHPLTCSVDSIHDLLVPRDDGKKVVLVCPTCGKVQDFIPAVVLMLYDEHVRKKGNYAGIRVQGTTAP